MELVSMARCIIGRKSSNTLIRHLSFFCKKESCASPSSFRPLTVPVSGYRSNAFRLSQLHYWHKNNNQLLLSSVTSTSFPLLHFNRNGFSRNSSVRHYSDDKSNSEEPKSLIDKFKALWKKYWYIVLPVHVITSCMWLGGFYYASVR